MVGGLFEHVAQGWLVVCLGTLPRNGWLGFITRDARVTHRGPNWFGIHHPRMGGLPIGAQI
eukprot:1142416-Prymnesium_polylepis.1